MTSGVRVCLLALALASGCASALPSFQGGSTTPRYRTDIAGGAAARLPFGDLRPDENDPTQTAFQEADGGGIVPVAFARLGLARQMDVGLMAAGTTLKLDMRRELVLEEDTTRRAFVIAVSPYVGFMPDRGEIDGHATRFGVDVPLTYGLDIGGLYEVWLGPRIGMEGLVGNFETATDDVNASVFILRTGGVAGIAAGFRRVHTLFELGFAWEHQWGTVGTRVARGGVVLTPAFGLRIRL